MENNMSIVTLSSLSKEKKGSYGIGASAVPYSEDLYTYLRITDINDDGTLNMADLKSVDDEKAGDYLLEPNDIVFARTGASTGRNYFYDGSDGEFVYAGFLIKFSIDEAKVNPKYIKYYCLSQQYKDWVLSYNTGSTRGNINAQTLGNMPIPLPSKEQQDKMVCILSDLDTKIKINNDIYSNLQQQAQTIYHDIFLKHQSSRWELGKLSDLITVKYGKDHKKLEDGIYPVYGSGGIMRYVEKPLYTHESVLIPRKGTLNNVMYVNEPFWSVDTMFYTEMKINNVAKFVYHFVKSKNLLSLNVGSAVPSMTTDILNNMELYIPDEDTLKSFEDVISPLYEKMQQIVKENKKILSIRDCIIPKLINSEIDLTDIDI